VWGATREKINGKLGEKKGKSRGPLSGLLTFRERGNDRTEWKVGFEKGEIVRERASRASTATPQPHHGRKAREVSHSEGYGLPLTSEKTKPGKGFST